MIVRGMDRDGRQNYVHCERGCFYWGRRSLSLAGGEWVAPLARAMSGSAESADDDNEWMTKGTVFLAHISSIPRSSSASQRMKRSDQGVGGRDRRREDASSKEF